MIPSTCVIRGNIKASDELPCPLCSDHILKHSILLQELEQIEHKYLGRIEPEAIVRIQFDHYERTYRKPLADNHRNHVTLTKANIRTHFEEHRISHSRMILNDVREAKRVQREMMQSDMSASEGKVKTWMQLSKHKHDLIRMLSTISDNGPVSESSSNSNRLHSV